MTNADKYTMILYAVCTEMGVPIGNVQSTFADGITCKARHRIMYICHSHGMTKADIGRLMKRHHTTVMDGVNNVDAHVLIYEDDRFFINEMFEKLVFILNEKR